MSIPMSMSTSSDYVFNNLGRIGDDKVDESQRTIENTRYTNYMLDNTLLEAKTQEHVTFATQFASVNFNGGGVGPGIPSNFVDSDSDLIHSETTRALEKLQLNERMFVTVPYLGRGYGNPVLESQLQQGEAIGDRKSLSTIMEQNFVNYDDYPLLSSMKNQVTDPSYSVEEVALNGWVRGGVPSRDIDFKNKQ